MLATEEDSDETWRSKRTQKDRQTFGTLHNAFETQTKVGKTHTKKKKMEGCSTLSKTQRNPTSAISDERGIYPKSNNPQQHQKHRANQTQLLPLHQSFSAPTLLPVILLLSLKLANLAAILLLCCWPNPSALSLVPKPGILPPFELFAGAYLSLSLLISRRRFRHGEKCSPPSRFDQTELNTLALRARSRTNDGRLDAETTFGSEAGEISGKAGAERTATL